MQFTNLLAVVATSLFCTSALASEPCNGRSVWKHPGDCHAFYQCDVGGVGVMKTCGDNQAFHPEWNACGPITSGLC